jgi:hypothetical protein
MGGVVMKPIDPEVVRAWVERTRREQGLPPYPVDPVFIARIVALLPQKRQTGSMRSASKVVRPGTAERTTARSSSDDTIER